jgi:hypothetical protein
MVSMPSRSVASSSSVGRAQRPVTRVLIASTVGFEILPDSSERSSSARSAPERDGSVRARRSRGSARSSRATDRISSATVASCATVALAVAVVSWSVASAYDSRPAVAISVVRFSVRWRPGR